MNQLRKNILIGLTVLGMGSAALGVQAQTPVQEGRHGSAMTQEQRQAKMAEHVAKRAARLHDALKITPAQENVFRAYVTAMQPQPLQASGERANWRELSAPQRMEKMIAMQKQRVAQMEASMPALNALYAALSPEQKKLFDENTMHGRGHGHGDKGNRARQG